MNYGLGLRRRLPGARAVNLGDDDTGFRWAGGSGLQQAAWSVRTRDG